MVYQTSLQTPPTKWIFQTVCLPDGLLPLSHPTRVSAERPSQDVQGKRISLDYFLQAFSYIAALGIPRNVRTDSFDNPQPEGGEKVRSPGGQCDDVGESYTGPPSGYHDVLS